MSSNRYPHCLILQYVIIYSILLSLSYSQSTICVWNSISAYQYKHFVYNGEYTISSDLSYNNSYWTKSACSTTYYMMYVNSTIGDLWMIDDYLETQYVDYQPYCYKQPSNPTNCGKNWAYYPGSGQNPSFLPTTVTNGSCPSLQCDTIKLSNTNEEYNNKIFIKNETQRNVFVNNDLYLYFNENTFKWYCSSTLANDECNENHNWFNQDCVWKDVDIGSSFQTCLIVDNDARFTAKFECIGATSSPTKDSTQPTVNPTVIPTAIPTIHPTQPPTFNPTADPTFNPIPFPTYNPSFIPTYNPATSIPTSSPSASPTTDPTEATVNSTAIPTKYPTQPPTVNPTSDPTINPTPFPTYDPSTTPTYNPSSIPTYNPITAISTAPPSGDNGLSKKGNGPTMPLLIVSVVAIICGIVILSSYCYRKRKQKVKEIKNNDYEYVQLVNLDHDDAHSKQTPNGDLMSTVSDGEIDIFDEVNNGYHDENDEDEDAEDGEDDQLYGKPIGNTKDGTAGQQMEVLHFYYMDYVEDEDNKNDDNASTGNVELYHEKQEWEMCLMHALNALLQKKEYTVKSMNAICKELAPNKLINPHKSVLQTGNYDANVLMMALNKINIDVEWFDSRKAKEFDLNDDTFLKYLEPDNKKLVGFILNNPQKTMFKMFSRRHWIAIKEINDVWYNLDSKLKTPQKYKNTEELTAFLVDSLSNNNAELMICRKENKYIIKKVEMNATINW